MHSNDSTKCYAYIGIIYILKFYSNLSDTIVSYMTLHICTFLILFPAT